MPSVSTPPIHLPYNLDREVAAFADGDWGAPEGMHNMDRSEYLDHSVQLRFRAIRQPLKPPSV